MTPNLDTLIAKYVMSTRHHLIQPEATFADLGIDPIDVMMLAMDIEDAFDLRLSDDTINAWCCIGDVERCVGRVVA